MSLGKCNIQGCWTLTNKRPDIPRHEAPTDPGLRAYWAFCTGRRRPAAAWTAPWPGAGTGAAAGAAAAAAAAAAASAGPVVCAAHFPNRPRRLHPLAVPLLALPSHTPAFTCRKYERLRLTVEERRMLQLLGTMRRYPSLFEAAPCTLKYQTAVQNFLRRDPELDGDRIHSALLWYKRQWARILAPYVHLREPDAMGLVRDTAPDWFFKVDRCTDLLAKVAEKYFLVGHEASIAALARAVQADRLDGLAASCCLPVDDLRLLWADLAELTRHKMVWAARAGDRLLLPPLAATPRALDPLRACVTVVEPGPEGAVRHVLWLVQWHRLEDGRCGPDTLLARWISAYREYCSRGRVTTLATLQWRWVGLRKSKQWRKLLKSIVTSFGKYGFNNRVFHISDAEMKKVKSVAAIDFPDTGRRMRNKEDDKERQSNHKSLPIICPNDTTVVKGSIHVQPKTVTSDSKPEQRQVRKDSSSDRSELGDLCEQDFRPAAITVNHIEIMEDSDSNDGEDMLYIEENEVKEDIRDEDMISDARNDVSDGKCEVSGTSVVVHSTKSETEDYDRSVKCNGTQCKNKNACENQLKLVANNDVKQLQSNSLHSQTITGADQASVSDLSNAYESHLVCKDSDTIEIEPPNLGGQDNNKIEISDSDTNDVVYNENITLKNKSCVDSREGCFRLKIEPCDEQDTARVPENKSNCAVDSLKNETYNIPNKDSITLNSEFCDVAAKDDLEDKAINTLVNERLEKGVLSEDVVSTSKDVDAKLLMLPRVIVPKIDSTGTHLGCVAGVPERSLLSPGKALRSPVELSVPDTVTSPVHHLPPTVKSTSSSSSSTSSEESLPAPVYTFSSRSDSLVSAAGRDGPTESDVKCGSGATCTEDTTDAECADLTSQRDQICRRLSVLVEKMPLHVMKRYKGYRAAPEAGQLDSESSYIIYSSDSSDSDTDDSYCPEEVSKNSKSKKSKNESVVRPVSRGSAGRRCSVPVPVAPPAIRTTAAPLPRISFPKDYKTPPRCCATRALHAGLGARNLCGAIHSFDHGCECDCIRHRACAGPALAALAALTDRALRTLRRMALPARQPQMNETPFLNSNGELIDLEDELECMPVPLYCCAADMRKEGERRKKGVEPGPVAPSIDNSKDGGYSEWMRQKNEYKKYFTINALNTSKSKNLTEKSSTDPQKSVVEAAKRIGLSADAPSVESETVLNKEVNDSIKNKPEAANDSEQAELGNSGAVACVQSDDLDDVVEVIPKITAVEISDDDSSSRDSCDNPLQIVEEDVKETDAVEINLETPETNETKENSRNIGVIRREITNLKEPISTVTEAAKQESKQVLETTDVIVKVERQVADSDVVKVIQTHSGENSGGLKISPPNETRKRIIFEEPLLEDDTYACSEDECDTKRRCNNMMSKIVPVIQNQNSNVIQPTPSVLVACKRGSTPFEISESLDDGIPAAKRIFKTDIEHSDPTTSKSNAKEPKPLKKLPTLLVPPTVRDSSPPKPRVLTYNQTPFLTSVVMPPLVPIVQESASLVNIQAQGSDIFLTVPPSDSPVFIKLVPSMIPNVVPTIVSSQIKETAPSIGQVQNVAALHKPGESAASSPVILDVSSLSAPSVVIDDDSP